MQIAVASGKGGTGKTSIATSLAISADGDVQLLDCDVEEPNAHIFLKPETASIEPVRVMVPCVDESRCTSCGTCSRVCRFNAIVSLKSKAMVFPELCHGCGGCALACPEGAITEIEREVGVVETGMARNVAVTQGRLNVGEAMSPPVIRAVRKRADARMLTIIDAPPGTSCPVIAAVRGSDYVLLITEPTPFGLNDLTLAVEMVRALGIPFGVLLNRADMGDDAVKRYCKDEDIDLVGEIPDDRRIAEAYSRGIPPAEALPGLQPLLRGMLNTIRAKTVEAPL